MVARRRPSSLLAVSSALWEPDTVTVPAVERDIEREYRTVLTDSRRWRRVVLRPGDVVVCTPPKCGTTWMQTIVANLVFPDGRFPSPVMELGPWIDARFFPLDDLLERLESQAHRRQIKTHTPADGIPWSPEVTYLVVGRDGRDACMSAFNHAGAMRVDVLERLLLSAVDEEIELGGGPPPADVHGFFAWWLAQPEMWFHHLASFWPHRDEANVAFFHYDDLLADLDGQMRRVADVLGIEIDPSRWSEQVERCTFAGMKAASGTIADFDSHFVGGADSFLYRGTNQRWRGVLTADELSAFEDACARWLPSDAVSWVQRTGPRGAG
jgi:aryl sulfotransferase